MTVQMGFYHYIVSYNMDLYRRCLGHCEALLQEEFQKWEKDWLETADDFEDEHTRHQFYEFVNSEHGERLEFQSILLSSFFAASFAMFEHELVGFCRRAKRESNTPFSVNDLSSPSPTERAKKYLTILGSVVKIG